MVRTRHYQYCLDLSISPDEVNDSSVPLHDKDNQHLKHYRLEQQVLHGAQRSIDDQHVPPLESLLTEIHASTSADSETAFKNDSGTVNAVLETDVGEPLICLEETTIGNPCTQSQASSEQAEPASTSSCGDVGDSTETGETSAYVDDTDETRSLNAENLAILNDQYKPRFVMECDQGSSDTSTSEADTLLSRGTFVLVLPEENRQSRKKLEQIF